MFRGITGILIGVVAIAAVAAGCGGSGSSSSAITRATYIKQADAICKSGEAKKNKAIGEGFANRPKGLTEEEFQEELVIKVALPPIAQMTEELAELEAPAGDEKKIEELVAAFEKEVATLEADPALVVETKGGFFEEPDALAAEYGLKVCKLV